MWIFGWKGPSGFSARSTAEEVTEGIDGNGLTAIITGASSGLGEESTRVLALRGIYVIMAVRNVEAGRKVKEAVLKEVPSAKIDVMELDLSSMDSVRKFASDYIASGHALNILMNNAGVMATPFMLSHDGIELQFATNHLGHFLLTNLLLETMKKTVLESKKEGRIVNLSSEGHRITYGEGIRFDKINNESEYRTLLAYGQSKLSNILHAKELAMRLKKDFIYLIVSDGVCRTDSLQEEKVEITVNALHPGAIATNLLRFHGLLSAVASAVGKFILKNVQQGAATQCYVALNPKVKGVSGEYFVDSNISNPTNHAEDMELAKKLWDFSVDLTSAK